MFYQNDHTLGYTNIIFLEQTQMDPKCQDVERSKTIRLHLVNSLHQTQIMAAELVLEP